MKARLAPVETRISNPNLTKPYKRTALKNYLISKVLFGGLLLFCSVLVVSLSKVGPSRLSSSWPSRHGGSSLSSIQGQRTTMFTSTRRTLKFTNQEKKAALRKLEDVLLEPPRASSGISRSYLKKTKFLPDLLNDSLEGYSRRVFIDVGERDGGANGTKWFEEKYPTRNQEFEVYRIETVAEAETGPPPPPLDSGLGQMEMSDWLRRNVKEEEFVVMKAEAEVVEEMLKTKEAIELVDELFLECKPKGKGYNYTNKRAYWECLALYGRLRDLGIAVHQWWG
ncbi:hypothetical protein V2J09_016464 [Rumex salicifolius]